MYDGHDGFARHVAAENQYIGSIEFSSIEKFAPANVRPMNIGGKKEFCHGQTPCGKGIFCWRYYTLQ
jgi:hypothetical protein